MKQLDTVMQAAERLNSCRATIYKLVREHKMDAVRVGRSIRIDTEGFIKRGGCDAS